jgi:hypothetical protein
MAKKNTNQIIYSIIALALSIAGLVVPFLFPFLGFRDSDTGDYGRIFYNGRWKTKVEIFNSIIINNGGASSFDNFTQAVPILVLIGSISIVLGSLYWFLLALSGNDCILTNRKIPGPITGVLSIVGGVVGFIGTMIFIDFGKEPQINDMSAIFLASTDLSYRFAFYFCIVIFSLYLLLGILLLFMTFTGRDKKRRRRRR